MALDRTELGLGGLCSDPLWDEQLSWNTTDPNFTVCLQKSLLVWIPCVVLWLLTPLQASFGSAVL